MFRLFLGFLAFAFAIFLCAFAASQTFESWRIVKGETAWIQTSRDFTAWRTHYSGSYVAAARARGVNGFGLTWVDIAWQDAGFPSDFAGKSADLFTLSLNIDLILASGGYVVLRHQPWAYFGQRWIKDPAVLMPPLTELARMLKGKNLKRVALQLFGEPGAQGTLDAAGNFVPFPPDKYDGELLVRTHLLEDAYTYCLPLLQKEAPGLTFIRSPVGFGHLNECKYMVTKYPGTMIAHDVYLDTWQPIEQMIADDAAFHKARGEKPIYLEAGYVHRAEVGTLKELTVRQRITSSCALWKIPLFWWVQAGA